MKVFEAIKKLEQLDQESSISIQWVTEAEVRDVARERNIQITDEDVRLVIEHLEDASDNWDDIVGEVVANLEELRELNAEEG